MPNQYSDSLADRVRNKFGKSLKAVLKTHQAKGLTVRESAKKLECIPETIQEYQRRYGLPAFKSQRNIKHMVTKDKEVVDFLTVKLLTTSLKLRENR